MVLNQLSFIQLHGDAVELVLWTVSMIHWNEPPHAHLDSCTAMTRGISNIFFFAPAQKFAPTRNQTQDPRVAAEAS